MVGNLRSRWAVNGASFIVWALAAASAVYWGLRMSAPAGGVAAPALAAHSAPVADPAAVARLLGGAPTAAAAPSLGSRITLVGVVADRSTKEGAALIAIDGKPAKPFRVGSTVESGLVVQSLQARRAVLAASVDGPAVLTLELPPLRR